MKQKSLHLAMLIVAVVVGTFIGIWQVRPLPANEDSPSFMYMMYNIERMAVSPRHSGSPEAIMELERVRQLIITEIESMGLMPEIQQLYLTNDDAIEKGRILGRGIHFFRDGVLPVQNILARLEASETDRIVMFVAHYDSHTNSPGAADAMLGVTAMLEAMRNLTQYDTLDLATNIYFLFTDAEEVGLFGAFAFLRANPYLRDRVDMVINLEAVGNAGGAVLFETSPYATRMLNMVNRAVPRPIGFSLAQTIYQNFMSNATDFCMFLAYGWPGVNFALTMGAQYYHTPNDTYENLDRNAAYNYLRTVLALADYAANNRLDSLHQPSTNAVFFTFFPGNLVVLSYGLAYFLCGIACALALVYLILRFKNRSKADNGKSMRITIFSATLIVVLTLLSIGSAIFLHAGSYLFWIPLFAIVIAGFLRKWETVHKISLFASITVALILWTPIVYLVGGLLMFW